jgi:flavin reductase (DIM6/NTAB) family NADH-FMN oxidoreductase RutF
MRYRSGDVPREIASRLWSALISPRPVSLIVSRSEDGRHNIAAFSSLALVSIYPPIISISFGKRNGVLKNTLSNILATKQFSLNAVPRHLAETANKSAEGLELADDFSRLGLSLRQFEESNIIGIAESPLSIACGYSQIVEVEGSSITLLLANCGEVIIDDQFGADGLFDPLKADLIGSVGLEEFITVRGESFSLPRTWE